MAAPVPGRLHLHELRLRTPRCIAILKRLDKEVTYIPLALALGALHGVFQPQFANQASKCTESTVRWFPLPVNGTDCKPCREKKKIKLSLYRGPAQEHPSLASPQSLWARPVVLKLQWSKDPPRPSQGPPGFPTTRVTCCGFYCGSTYTIPWTIYEFYDNSDFDVHTNE